MTVTKTETKMKDKTSTGLLVLPTGIAHSDTMTVCPLPLPPSTSSSISSSSSTKNKQSSSSSSSSSNTNALSHLHLHAVYNNKTKGIDDDSTLHLQAIVEFHKYAPSYGSFLLVPSSSSTSSNDEVNAVSNGKLTFMTRIDPLFVVLSLPCAQRLDVFQPFRDYTVYTAASHDCESVDVDMTGLVTDEQLSLVCETKNALGETYYRVTEEKVMQWLLTKLCKLNETKESTTNDDKVIVQQQQQQQEKIVAIRDRRHAIDLIAHYLSDDWAIKFKHAVGFITNTENGKNANGLQQHEDNGEIPTMQTQGIAADLAMSVMLADAQTNNDGFDTTQYQQQQSTPTGRKQPSRKPMVSSNVSANAKKFWAAQSGKKDKDGNVKAKTTSGTKGKTSATGGNVNAKRKRSGK